MIAELIPAIKSEESRRRAIRNARNTARAEQPFLVPHGCIFPFSLLSDLFHRLMRALGPSLRSPFDFLASVLARDPNHCLLSGARGLWRGHGGHPVPPLRPHDLPARVRHLLHHHLHRAARAVHDVDAGRAELAHGGHLHRRHSLRAHRHGHRPRHQHRVRAGAGQHLRAGAAHPAQRGGAAGPAHLPRRGPAPPPALGLMCTDICIYTCRYMHSAFHVDKYICQAWLYICARGDSDFKLDKVKA
mmetsp:Transcript_4858/g.15119  ORF Transcript_4858/g.15119 Transcript_4858/m.15119 type:complete len:245 (-) Transcript_4858:219-953(-)